MTKRRNKRRRKLPPVKTRDMYEPPIEDVLFWAKLNPAKSMFTDAAKKIKKLDGECTVQWPTGARELTVIAKSPTKAIRSRKRNGI